MDHAQALHRLLYADTALGAAAPINRVPLDRCATDFSGADADILQAAPNFRSTCHRLACLLSHPSAGAMHADAARSRDLSNAPIATSHTDAHHIHAFLRARALVRAFTVHAFASMNKSVPFWRIDVSACSCVGLCATPLASSPSRSAPSRKGAVGLARTSVPPRAAQSLALRFASFLREISIVTNRDQSPF
eukprot:5329534-Pleurochrysis_carterae.AAC.1